MDDVYNAADIYYLNMRPVDGDEKRVLENRMKWVLTGGEEHLNDSEAIGREAGVQKKKEDAQMRMLGKRTSKRKNKRSNFKHRPDKTKTEKRKTLSTPKRISWTVSTMMQISTTST